MTFLDTFRERAAPFRNVLAFSFRHWRHQRALVILIATGVMLMTMADVLLPVYVGRLIDALAPAVQTGIESGQAADRGAAMHEAIVALASMVGLGVLMLVARHIAFVGVVHMTLRQMVDVARDAFWKVQRFAAEWHANTFAGSIVRKVTRGMWAIDLLNDTLLLALLPSFVVLVGSTVLLGYYWPLMGLVVTLGALAFIGMT
ncbi:MAG: ABC transporter transmembrane domain-containing protein, partial [Dongiaceae bacterium]